MNNSMNNHINATARMRNHYLVCGWPLGPRGAPLQQSADGPARAFAAWWAMHGDAVRLFVRNSREDMRRLSGLLRALLRDYSHGYHVQEGMHERVYEARLSNLVQLERVYFHPVMERMELLLAASFDGAEELDDDPSITQEFATEIAVFRRAQSNLRLFTRVLHDFSQVLHPPGQNPDSLDPARI
jgi:hypothetical protein